MQKNVEIKEMKDLHSDQPLHFQNAGSGCAHCDNAATTDAILPKEDTWKKHWNLLVALFILVVMLVLKYGFDYVPPKIPDFSIHFIAFLLAGYNVLDLAWRKTKSGDVFNEFVLMSVATLGAFYIGAYSEGVAVMVFYCIGEWFQDSAVRNAKRNIKALLDIRPDEVTVLQNGQQQVFHPSKVNISQNILVRPGEKVALDGILISENASFNSSALTGESVPVSKMKNDQIYAGMINLNTPSEIKVTALFKDSALSRILQMVQDATARKSQTQLFISKFAKVYTPIVFFFALALCFVPYFFVDPYIFDVWFYRGLVFLVISCPCALVVSIPLGYFGGIGLASRNGILFKGGNYLDVMTKVDTVVMDKTGTLTKGVFSVQKVSSEGIEPGQFLKFAYNIEKHSTHPIAKAIVEFAAGKMEDLPVTNVEEFAGMGLSGTIAGKQILAGNSKLLRKNKVAFPAELEKEAETIVLIAIDDAFAGYFLIADEIKEDAAKTIEDLHQLNIQTIMLSGDKENVVKKVADQLGIKRFFGDLLPQNKLEKVEQLKQAGKTVAFCGDGVNDAPVIALADVGMAMGGLGSDATIETADVVIQNDQPHKIVAAIKIGKLTRNIVWQNIIMAMSVKLIVLILGAGGVATLWEAVIADVGVALLAILNAIRIQKKVL